MEVDVVAAVLDLDQAASRASRPISMPSSSGDEHPRIGFRGAEAVDAGDRGDDEDVAAGEEAAGGAVAELVDLFVDRRILFDEGVGADDVGFGLVVVVVGDEIFDGVVGEEFLEFAVELRGQGLVVGKDQGRPLHLRDDVGHGKGLARAGDAEEDLMLVAAPQPFGQFGNGAGLIAGGLIGGFEFEFGHGGKDSIKAGIFCRGAGS